jgi:hypothetical protein
MKISFILQRIDETEQKLKRVLFKPIVIDNPHKNPFHYFILRGWALLCPFISLISLLSRRLPIQMQG